MRELPKIWVHTLAAAFLLIASGHSQATVSGQQQGMFPPEALVPNADAQRFFDDLARRVSEERELPSLPAEATEALDAMLAEFFARGERVDNWWSSGVNLRAIMEARAGGIRGNAIMRTSDLGPSFVYAFDYPLEAMAPPGWALIGRHGELGDMPAENEISTEAGPISPKLMLVARTSNRRHGTALCSKRTELRIYANPEVEASDADRIAWFALMRMAAYSERITVCETWVEVSPGRYQDRNFDEDGYLLPNLNTQNDPPAEIVPISSMPIARPVPARP